MASWIAELIDPKTKEVVHTNQVEAPTYYLAKKVFFDVLPNRDSLLFTDILPFIKISTPPNERKRSIEKALDMFYRQWRNNKEV